MVYFIFWSPLLIIILNYVNNVTESASIINSDHQATPTYYQVIYLWALLTINLCMFVVLLMFLQQEGQQQEQTSPSCAYVGSRFEKSYENKFKIPRNIYDLFKPTEHIRKLIGYWSHPIITNINELISTCPLTFTYNHCRGYNSRKYMCNFWKGKAFCKCGLSKIHCYIEKEPQDNDESVLVNFQVFGKCSRFVTEEVDSSLIEKKSSSEGNDINPHPIGKDLSGEDIIVPTLLNALHRKVNEGA